jgi:UTP--glucose-1-phosphate uridylyltransferase
MAYPQIKKAVIPAAGYGTRNLPITKVIPKEMLPICNKPAIQYIVEEAEKSGIEEILIIVSRSKNAILDYFDRSLELEAFLEKKNMSSLLEKLTPSKVHIQYVRQSYAKGLGDALKLAKPFVAGQPFAVLLPDDIILSGEKNALADLIDVYQSHGGSVISLQEVRKNELKNYGVINGKEIKNGLYQITDIMEKPQFSPPTNLRSSAAISCSLLFSIT